MLNFKKTLLVSFLCLTTLVHFHFLSAEEPASETLTFSPPAGWGLAPRELLTENIKVMVMGKGDHEYPPSINLTLEPWNGTLLEYLKVIRDLNDSQSSNFKELGQVKTEAGEAFLTQEDMRTKWGEVRQMHLLHLHKGTVYILTAASMKEEFPKFYKDFYSSMTSLRIIKNVFDTVPDEKKRQSLKQATTEMGRAFQLLVGQQKKANPNLAPGPLLQQVFSGADFQTKFWEPFKTRLSIEYTEMGPEWQNLVLGQVQTSLVNG
jgi:hypothetical protein